MKSWLDKPRPKDNFWGPVWDIGRGGRELYQLGTAAAYAVEGAIAGGLEVIVKPVSQLSDLGTVTFGVPTPSGRVYGPYTVDFQAVGTVAGCIDQYAGGWLREHRRLSFEAAEYYLLESGFAPGEIAYEWKKGEDGVWRAYEEWVRGDDGVWRLKPLRDKGS